MKVSANPNSNDWVLKWGSVQITIDGQTIEPKNCCYAESGTNGVVHIYDRTQAGQILKVKGVPRATEYKGNVTVVVGNTQGCKPCTRSSYKRRNWWETMHLEK